MHVLIVYMLEGEGNDACPLPIDERLDPVGAGDSERVY